jgi:hypothetical protein
MEISEIDNKNSKLGVDDESTLTRKELQAWGTKIIAAARPKKDKGKRAIKKKRMSRKEYTESMSMKDKWCNHYYGRNKQF